MADRWPDLDVLQLLVGVAELGSVGAAAAHVGISQPSASSSITRCERRLGFKILDRSPRGSTLTTDGALYVDWARDLLFAAERMQSATAALRSARAAHLRVAASMTVAEYLVPKWLGAFRRNFARVDVNLSVLNSDQVVEEVSGGHQDLGFIETTQPVRGLHVATLRRDQLVVVVAPDNVWARRSKPVPAAELAATPLVQREEGSGTRRTFIDACRAAGLEPPNPAQSLASNTAVRVAAMAGTAPAVLSQLAVRDAVAVGDLVVVPVSGIDLRRPIRAIWTGPKRALGPTADFLSLAQDPP
ncbi:LysR family transcriptional regulator [Knoellia sp. Soil729]|uniref:LysR family transcriptional regulator n=1 Tax=Knoellia sp. Soil729 TaxID=1736394 RepID=UPI0009E89B7A